MEWFRHQSWIRRWVVLTYAAAMLAVGFAHTAAAAPALPNGAEWSSYVLPDGSLPSICLNGGQGDEPSHAAKPLCDACLLTAAPGLGETTPVGEVFGERTIETLSASTATASLSARSKYVAHLRGPPSV